MRNNLVLVTACNHKLLILCRNKCHDGLPTQSDANSKIMSTR